MTKDLVKLSLFLFLAGIAGGLAFHADRIFASDAPTVYVHMDRGTALNILRGLDEGHLDDGTTENLRTYLRAAIEGEIPSVVTPQQQADAQRLREIAGEPLVPAVIRAELAQIAARLEGGLIQ